MARYSKANPPQGMTEAGYARHRGVSRPSVQNYRRYGYLALFPDGSIDAEASDRVLAGCLDPTRRRAGRVPEIRLSLADIYRLYGG